MSPRWCSRPTRHFVDREAIAMGFFQNLKLGTKLFGAFAFLLAQMIALGAYSVSQLSLVNGATVELATNWLPSVRAVLTLKADLNRFRVLECRHILSNTPEQKQAVEHSLDEKLAEMRKIEQEYSALLSIPSERSLYEGVFKPSF